MRQVLRAGTLGRPRGMGWGGRQEGGSGWGTNVNPWLIHVNVWQKPLQYCKVISLQLIKINEKKEKIYKNMKYFKNYNTDGYKWFIFLNFSYRKKFFYGLWASSKHIIYPKSKYLMKSTLANLQNGSQRSTSPVIHNLVSFSPMNSDWLCVTSSI